jgi:hypothetical protein
MKKSLNNGFIYLILISTTLFFSCSNSSDEFTGELTMEEKIELLERSEWLLKGFEDRVMFTFAEGKRHRYYGQDGVFGEAIPGTIDYNIQGDLIFMDFHFDHTATYELKFSCDGNIVEFFGEDGELNSTLFKKDSNYRDCLD